MNTRLTIDIAIEHDMLQKKFPSKDGSVWCFIDFTVKMHALFTGALFYAIGHRVLIRERSFVSRDDLIQIEGTVTRVLGGGTLEIECNNNMVVRAVLSGRMKKYRIKVMAGDRVQVSVSPYDTSHGLITYRL